MAVPLAVVALYPSSEGRRPGSRPRRISEGEEGTGWNGSSTICSPAVRIVSFRKISGIVVASGAL